MIHPVSERLLEDDDELAEDLIIPGLDDNQDLWLIQVLEGQQPALLQYWLLKTSERFMCPKGVHKVILRGFRGLIHTLREDFHAYLVFLLLLLFLLHFNK